MLRGPQDVSQATVAHPKGEFQVPTLTTCYWSQELRGERKKSLTQKSVLFDSDPIIWAVIFMFHYRARTMQRQQGFATLLFLP